MGSTVVTCEFDKLLQYYMLDHIAMKRISCDCICWSPVRDHTVCVGQPSLPSVSPHRPPRVDRCSKYSPCLPTSHPCHLPPPHMLRKRSQVIQSRFLLFLLYSTATLCLTLRAPHWEPYTACTGSDMPACYSLPGSTIICLPLRWSHFTVVVQVRIAGEIVVGNTHIVVTTFIVTVYINVIRTGKIISIFRIRIAKYLNNFRARYAHRLHYINSMCGPSK